MKSWNIIFRVIILTMGIGLMVFDVLLYRFCEKQKAEFDNIRERQKSELQINNNQFKYQQEQIERLSKDLDEAKQGQGDALLQEAAKRKKIEDESKSIQTSLMDIKAEADAIKQEMKGWQKDYVTVLALLEKRMDGAQEKLEGLKNSLTALNVPEMRKDINILKSSVEKITHSAEINASSELPVSQRKRDEHIVENHRSGDIYY